MQTSFVFGLAERHCAQFKFILTFSFLFLFGQVATSEAQLEECFSRTQTGTTSLNQFFYPGFPPTFSGVPTATIPLISFPAAWEQLPTPNFPDGQGTATLIEARLGVNMQCSLTGGLELLTGWGASVVTPVHGMALNASTTHAGAQYFTPFTQSSTLSGVYVSGYDGITDYSGTSGFTRTNSASGVLNQTLPATAFGAPWGYYPFNLMLTSQCYMEFLGSTLWVYSSFWQSTAFFDWQWKFIYSTVNNQAADCNLDGVSDSCDSLVNNIPQTIVPGVNDNCQTDCDDNGVWDSLQILANPSLDSSAEFGGDGKVDKCQGRVRWQAPAVPVKGITNALISAYWVSGSESFPVFNPLPADPLSSIRRSDSQGKFLIPREYFSAPLQPGEIMRGIRASVDYAEDTGLPNLNIRTISNYPGWDPLSPLRSGKLDRTIYFPSPIVFQPGVLGTVNGIASSVSSFRDFLALDSAGSSADQYVKRGIPSLGRRPIPSFLLYAMPSGGPSVPTSWASDGVSWGYDNAPLKLTERGVYSNIGRLNDYIQDRVKPSLEAITQGNEVNSVPLNISAHSYGGIISRGFMALRQPYPLINRYVSFDGVHGGSNVFSSLNRSNFFRERSINGTSPFDLTAPNSKGWNYSNFLSTSANHLFLSDSGCSPLNPLCEVISPDSSALGVGRTMGTSRYDGGPNGHCARFAGGWELLVPEGNHSLQTITRDIVTAARFFADGGRPAIGTALDPGASSTQAEFSADPMDSRYAAYGCGVQPPADTTPFGKLDTKLSLLASGSVNYTFQVDSFGAIHFEFDISDANASIEVTNNTGATVYPKLNRVVSPSGSGWYTESFDVDINGTGVRKLRLSSTGPAEAYGRIGFLNKRFLTGSTNLESYPPNATVTVIAKMRGASGGVIAPNSGTISTVITAPDGAQTQLDLFDDGLHGDGAANNGTYANYFTGTAQAGFYRISNYASYVWAGWPIMRSSENSFEVISNAATIAPTVSQQMVLNPQTGRVDAWRLRFTVNAIAAGTFRLIGDLAGPNVVNQSLDTVLTVAAPGTYLADLVIPLTLLHTLPRTGLSLGNIRLVDPALGQTLANFGQIAIALPAISTLNLLPAPVITQVIPAYGPTALPNGEGVVVIIKGANFDTTSLVRVGRLKAKYQILGGDTLQVTMPTNYPATANRPKPVDIEVTTAGGVTQLVSAFVYNG